MWRCMSIFHCAYYQGLRKEVSGEARGEGRRVSKNMTGGLQCKRRSPISVTTGIYTLFVWIPTVD
jgi:hypothetical protein